MTTVPARPTTGQRPRCAPTAKKSKPPAESLLADAVRHMRAARRLLEQFDEHHGHPCRCAFCAGQEWCDINGLRYGVGHLVWVLDDAEQKVESVFHVPDDDAVPLPF
jgi:hypothetical protein